MQVLIASAIPITNLRVPRAAELDYGTLPSSGMCGGVAAVSESESKSTDDLPDFIPTHLLEREPYFERRSARESGQTREGLPPSYRMRADAHYVDQLTGPPAAASVHLLKADELVLNREGVSAPALLSESVEKHGVLLPLLVQRKRGRYRIIDGNKRLLAAMAAGLSEVPCLLHDIDDAAASAMTVAANSILEEPAPSTGFAAADGTAAIGREVAQSLAAIGSSVNLLSLSGSALSRRVAVDLIQAELWRATCLVEAGRVLRGERPASVAAVSPARVLDQVIARAATEARLRGIDLVANAVDSSSGAVIRGDESLLVLALSSMLLVTLGFVESAAASRVTLSISSRSAGHVVFDVSQDAVLVPDNWVSRALDATWVDRPGGQQALVLMLAAERIASACAGKAAVVATVLGTTISLTVPIASR